MLFFPPAEVAQQSPAPPPPAPSPALAFDLAGALARARTENPMLRAAKARVEERQGLITATRADALPQVTLTGDYTRLRDDSLLMGGTGALVSAFPVPAGQPPLNLAQLAAPYNVYSTQLSLSQPLFYWGKLGTAVEVAKMGEKEAGFAYSTAELDTLHGVARLYLGALAAQADLEVIQTRLKTAEQFLADVKARLEAQTATELDRLRAESEYLGVIPENLQAEAAYQRAVELLDGQLALDPGTPLQLKDLGAPDATQLPAQGERSEIAQFRQQEEMYRANDKIIRSDLRPKVDFNASYGYQASHTPELFQSLYDTWKVNVSLRFPLFDGQRAAGKRAQNRAQLEQVIQARVDKERAIAVETRSAERELGKSIALRAAAEQAYAAALEALRTSREFFDQGLITSLDLLQAERTERQQASQRKRAELGVWTALFDYRRSCGLPPL